MNKKTNYRFFVICILGMLSYVASAQITGKVSNVLNSEMCKDSALLEARKYVDTQVDSSGDTLIVHKYIGSRKNPNNRRCFSYGSSYVRNSHYDSC